MRVTVMSVFLWVLFLAAQIDARPQELGITKATQPVIAKVEDASDARDNSTSRTIASIKAKEVGSRVVAPSNGERDLKGYQYMDNSLRTVATQLLNVSSNEESNLKDNNRLDKVESKLGLLIRKPDNPPIGEISSNRDYFNDHVRSDIVASDMVDVSFDRSSNSKYNYFKTSHPGEAMAISEEELERELASSKTTQKRKPTTTGGLSTWILLNPPSTTAKSLIMDKSKEAANNQKENQKKTTLNLVKPTVSTVKFEPTIKGDLTTPSMQKNSFTRLSSIKGNNKQNPSTLSPEKSTSDITFYTTMKSETIGNTFDTTLMSVTTSGVDDDLIMSKVTTKRISSPNRTTKPAITTPKTTTVISQMMINKNSRPNNANYSTKSNVVRKTVTNKPELMKNSMNATSKIEKVTFRPVQMITTPKNTIQQSVPMFVTKLQASLHTDSKSNVPSISLVSIDSSSSKDDISKMNVTSNNRVQVPLKHKPSKPNNVLNVQLKKPVDTHTKIEVQPIKVNPPVLTIEKIGEPEKDISIDADKPIAMGDSKIDVKFIFNPELTKIVETPTGSTAAATTTPATTTTTTTKRPKQKRKKNKNRRRRPSTSTTSSPINTSEIATTLNTDSNSIDENQQIFDSAATGTSLQESKIVPEAEATSNATKNKKKQVDKPITSQIYSFLSREVMPSFGVMSLVGLGLGLASYFLYPFGGTISRRNYEVQPNYKYNLNEYGGNYGQSEEEVFSKVLQGMAASDGKYGGMKDYENNYYRYQAYDGAYTDPSYTTRRGDVRHPSSSGPIYRPVNTPVSYNSKYRKNEFQYSDLSTTPNYYERHTESGFMKSQGSADRQFVVGNVPKGYSYEDESSSKLTTTTESIQTDFEKQIAQSLKFAENPVNIPSNFEQPEAQALKANEGYEEIEVAPTAVVVEHGPRSLKLEKIEVSSEQMDDKNVKKIRRKRESVIQQIPTRTEIEKMEDEEDLSNEILDAIDSALPTMASGMEQMKIERDTPRVDKVDEKIELQDENKKNKSISTMKNPIVDMLPSLGNEDEVINSQGSKTTTQSNINKKYNSTKINESITTTSAKSSTTDKSIPSTVASFKTTTADDSSSTDPPIIVEIGDEDHTTVPIGVTILPSNTTTDTSTPERFNFFNFIKKIAEIKFRVGLTVLKHASENFAKYLGNVQKKLNGED